MYYVQSNTITCRVLDYCFYFSIFCFTIFCIWFLLFIFQVVLDPSLYPLFTPCLYPLFTPLVDFVIPVDVNCSWLNHALRL